MIISKRKSIYFHVCINHLLEKPIRITLISPNIKNSNASLNSYLKTLIFYIPFNSLTFFFRHSTISLSCID